MSFEQALQTHLRAIRERNVPAPAETIADDLTLVMSDGTLVRTAERFLSLHGDWFQSRTLTIETNVIRMVESPEMAMILLPLDFRNDPSGAPPVRESSYLTLMFARQGGRWVMSHDQITPVKSGRTASA
jgi:ketosteroid isomerase-like protein